MIGSQKTDVKRIVTWVEDTVNTAMKVIENVDDIEVKFVGPVRMRPKKQRKSRRRIENGVVKRNV